MVVIQHNKFLFNINFVAMPPKWIENWPTLYADKKLQLLAVVPYSFNSLFNYDA